MRLRYEEGKGDRHGQGKSCRRFCGLQIEEGVCVGDDAYARAGEVNERARHYGVRHSRRSSSRHCHFGDYGLPPETAGTMERHCGRNQRALETAGRSVSPAWQDVSPAKTRCVCGQSTVEFAVVMAGFLSLTIALGIMWRAFGGGIFVEHALAVASHHIQTVALVAVTDIFLY